MAGSGSLEAVVERLLGRVRELESVVVGQRRVITEQADRMATQADRIVELERRLGRDSSPSSRSPSSRSPSSDAPWEKQPAKKRSSRSRSGRKHSIPVAHSATVCATSDQRSPSNEAD